MQGTRKSIKKRAGFQLEVFSWRLLEGLNNTTETFSQATYYSDQVLKPETFEYWCPDSSVEIVTGIFLEGEDSHGDHGLGILVEFRFKAPPGTSSSSITTHTPSGQRNCASCSFQTRKSVTLQPCPRGRTTKSSTCTWWHWRNIYIYIYIYETYIMYHNIKCSNVASVYPFTDEAQTSLYKDPVRTAL